MPLHVDFYSRPPPERLRETPRRPRGYSTSSADRSGASISNAISTPMFAPQISSTSPAVILDRGPGATGQSEISQSRVRSQSESGYSKTMPRLLTDSSSRDHGGLYTMVLDTRQSGQSFLDTAPQRYSSRQSSLPPNSSPLKKRPSKTQLTREPLPPPMDSPPAVDTRQSSLPLANPPRDKRQPAMPAMATNPLDNLFVENILSRENFNRAMEDPELAAQLHRFAESRGYGQHIEFLRKVRDHYHNRRRISYLLLTLDRLANMRKHWMMSWPRSQAYHLLIHRATRPLHSYCLLQYQAISGSRSNKRPAQPDPV